MKKYAIEIVNVDEEVAEKAVRSSVQALAMICPQINVKSLEVEPHDDTRGVFCGLEGQSPAFVKLILDSLKITVSLSVYPAKPQIYVHTAGDRHPNE